MADRAPDGGDSRWNHPRRQTLRVCLGATSLLALAVGVLVYARGISGTALLWTELPLGVAACAAYFAYWITSYRVHTHTHQPPTAHPLESDFDAIRLQSHRYADDLDPLVLSQLSEALTDPDRSIQRIVDRVEPLVRSMCISSTYTFRVPLALAGHDLALPLFLQERGRLTNGLRLTRDDGTRVSSLSHDDAAALIGAVILMFVRLMHPNAEDDYVTHTERDVLAFLTASTPHSKKQVNDVIDQLAQLPRSDTPRSATAAIGINRLLRRLARSYPIIVSETVSPASGAFLGGFTLRLSSERREVARLAAQAGKGVEGWLTRIRDRVRRLLGVRPAIIGVPLSNASRCKSYHIQIAGPEATYLAKQRIANFPEGTLAPMKGGQYRMQPRVGQRQSHLYVRNGAKLEAQPGSGVDFDSIYFENHFFERTPGSVGVATLGALGTCVLIWVAALSRLGVSTSTNSDIVAAILAVPAAVTAWTGLEQSRTLIGGVLMASMSTLVTAATALAASMYYVLGPYGKPEAGEDAALILRDGAVVWVVLIAVATINLVACLGGWTLRSVVESHFVGRDNAPARMP